jgi:hypothetical protein
MDDVISIAFLPRGFVLDNRYHCYDNIAMFEVVKTALYVTEFGKYDGLMHCSTANGARVLCSKLHMNWSNYIGTARP